jgi:hypothetical protein
VYEVSAIEESCFIRNTISFIVYNRFQGFWKDVPPVNPIATINVSVNDAYHELQ